MKSFILGAFITFTAIAGPVTVLWVNGSYLEGYTNGFIFQNSSILSFLNSVPEYITGSITKRLDDAPKDRVHFQDFEGASVSFTCGTNLTKADNGSTPLNETTSVTFTQGATPPTVGTKCAGPTISLPLKAQSKNLVEVCFQATWSGNDNEMAVNIESGGSDLVQVLVPASTTAEKHCGYFSTSSTASIDLDIEVLTPNASDVLEIDDVEITVDPLTPTDIFATKEKTDFTPTGTWVTNTTYEGWYSRAGKFAKIVYRITLSGAPTAAALTVELPSGLDIDTTYLPTTDAKYMLESDVSLIDDGSGSPRRGAIKYVDSNTVSINVNKADLTNVYAEAVTATVPYTWGSGDGIFATLLVPIAQWEDTAQGVVVKNRTDSASVENRFDFWVTNNGTFNISEESIVGTFSGSRSAVGSTSITFNGLNLTVIPSVVCVADDFGNVNAEIKNVTTAGFEVRTYFANSAADTDGNYHCGITKMAPDYIKETDKVYTVPVGFKESASYNTAGIQTNFWDNTGAALTWDESLVTNLSSSENISISDGTTPDGTATKIIATQGVDIFVQIYGNVNSGNGIFVLNSSGDRLNYVVRNDGSNNYTTATGMVKLSAGDYLYFFNSSGLNREGGVSIWVKPSKEDGLWLGTFGQPTCYVKEVQTDSVSSTTSLSAGSFVTNTLNTTEGNCSFLSLALSVVTLEAGSYNIKCGVPVYRNDSTSIYYRWKTQLYNTSDSATAIIGGSASMRNSGNVGGGVDTPSILLAGTVTLSSSKNFELRTYVNNATGATIGDQAQSGISEVYSQCEITKVR